ncbi:MAG: serine/threonine protein kinase, partial [Actinomycetota bacterium]|nr:serine/threonine protein kinase [Actinomycetota bacterium]
MAQQTRRIQKYEILGAIGRGGMSTVYLAYDEDLGRHIALKELDLRDENPELVERFMRESRMAASLQHPNIVTVHERLHHEGVPYIAMEYLDRGSLRPRVGALTRPQTFGVLEAALAGLAHAHAQGVVHRDLKPENLLVTSEGTVKIADFGIAKALTRVTRTLTRAGASLGTPEYMAPEQVTNKAVGPATDLYSLGIIAFELVTGRVPFESGDEPLAVLFRHVNEAPPAPSTVAPGVDPQLDAWILRCLAKDPADRPPSAEEAWDELE